MTTAKPLRLSASSYKTFKDCPRKWWYLKVQGMQTLPTPNLTLGSDVHTLVEHRIKHNDWPVYGQVKMETAPTEQHFDRALTIARAGEEHLRGLAARFEHADFDAFVEARISLAKEVLGLPFLGFVDYCEEGPDGPRVIDHKTTGDLYAPWLHDRESLGHDPQLLIYAWALWSGEVKAPDSVTVEHYYYQTKGPPAFRPLSALVPWGRCESTAKAFCGVSDKMTALSRVSQPRDVPANTSACSKYGGCPFASICPVPKPKLTKPGGSRVGLLDRIQAAKAGAQNTPSPSPPPSAPAEPVVHEVTDINPPDGPGTETPTSPQITEAAKVLEKVSPNLRGHDGAEVAAWLHTKQGLAFLARHQLSVLDAHPVAKAMYPDWEEGTLPPAPADPAESTLPPEPGEADEADPPAPVDGYHKILVELLRENKGSLRVTDKRIATIAREALDVERLSRKARVEWLGKASDAGLVEVSATFVSLPGMDHGAIVDAKTTPTPAPKPPASVPAPVPKAPASAAAPKAPEPIQLVIYVDCMPMGFRVQPIDEVLDPIYKKVTQREGVPWLLVDYNKGPAMVLAEAQAVPPPTGMVSVRSDHPLARHLSMMWPKAQMVVALR